MKQQLVSINIINKTLNLPEYTPVQETLMYIHELTAFRKKHQLCNNIIFTLRHELAKLQLQINRQTNQYLNNKLNIAKLQSQRLFKFEELGTTLASVKTKKYPKYQTLQQFMNDELQIKTIKCKQKQNRLKLTHDLSYCFVPLATAIEYIQQKQSQRQVETRLQQELSISDSI